MGQRAGSMGYPARIIDGWRRRVHRKGSRMTSGLHMRKPIAVALLIAALAGPLAPGAGAAPGQPPAAGQPPAPGTGTGQIAAAKGETGAGTDAQIAQALMSLARILGALHHLRPLCAPGEGQMWRDRMLALLDAGPIAARHRDRLIMAFNAAHADSQRAHRRCTRAAANLGNTHVRDGTRAAQALARHLQPTGP